MTKLPKFLAEDYSDIDRGLIGVNKISYKEICGLDSLSIKKQKKIHEMLKKSEKITEPNN